MIQLIMLALTDRIGRNCAGVDGADRDRRDDIVLATYLASGADYLLTGDDDLLSLRPDYSILTAREFYDRHLR